MRWEYKVSDFPSLWQEFNSHKIGANIQRGRRVGKLNVHCLSFHSFSNYLVQGLVVAKLNFGEGQF